MAVKEIPVLTQAQIDNFWSKAAITANPDRCWEWKLYKRPNGYAYFSINRSDYGAHRVAYSINSPISKDDMDKNVCHSCDNPSCVNPKHLWLGTQLENIKDRDSKGRRHTVKGEQNGHAKLTEEQVLEIRKVYIPRHKDFSQRALARKYGLIQASIRDILIGKNWKHI